MRYYNSRSLEDFARGKPSRFLLIYSFLSLGKPPIDARVRDPPEPTGVVQIWKGLLDFLGQNNDRSEFAGPALFSHIVWDREVQLLETSGYGSVYSGNLFYGLLWP